MLVERAKMYECTCIMSCMPSGVHSMLECTFGLQVMALEHIDFFLQKDDGETLQVRRKYHVRPPVI